MSSPRASDYATPAAVLLGCGLIAWVTHHDLRLILDALPPPGVSARALPSPPDAASAPSSASPSLMAPPLSPEALERDAAIRRKENVQNLLSTQRAAYAEACWGPSLRIKGHAPPLLVLTVDFDASGKETHRTARELTPIGAPAAPALDKVLDCVVHSSLPKLSVDPPGKPLTLELTLPLQ